ncbi:hypothetical protein CVT24_009700, partial [Panaeolus cyanescens]
IRVLHLYLIGSILYKPHISNIYLSSYTLSNQPTMAQQRIRKKTDMGWPDAGHLWDFTLLSEPLLSSELARLSGVKSIGDSDVLSFQPCPNPEESSQDRYVINDWSLLDGAWSFRALFDGHAGHEVADYTAERLPGLINSALRALLDKTSTPSPDAVADMLKDTVSKFDESIGQALRDLFPDESVLAKMTDNQIRDVINDNGPNAAAVRRCTRGTTVLIALVDPSKSNLWVASLGDCAAVLASKKSDKWDATVLSTAHNGEAKGEAEKIITEHPNEPEVMLDDRVLGSIAVTRAVGDFAFKLPAVYTTRVFLNLEPGYNSLMKSKVNSFIHRNLTPPYMSGVPDVKHMNLKAGGATESFLILCTDGLIDLHDERLELETLLAQRWVKFLGPKIADKDNNMALALLREALGGSDAELVSRMITVEMTSRWMDDTTVIVQHVNNIIYLFWIIKTFLTSYNSTTTSSSKCLRKYLQIPSFLHASHVLLPFYQQKSRRRVASLPPISAEVFNQKVLDRRQETAIMSSTKGSSCEVCNKTYTTENAYRSHIQSKKHKENEVKAATRPKVTVDSEVPSDTVPSAPEAEIIPEEKPSAPEASTTEKEAVEADEEDDLEKTIEEKIAAARSRLSTSNCLFCPHTSQTLEDNLTHMSLVHSFFIPDAEYLVDIAGLITYLGEKIAVGNVCIHCNDKGREFRSMDAVRKHMVDKGHCKIAYDTEIDRLEVSDYYDFSSSYPDGQPPRRKKSKKAAKPKVEDEDWEEVSDEDAEVDEVVDEDASEPEDSETDDESEDDLPENQLTYGDTEYELVLPSGARIGHRTMRRYYAQSFPAVPRGSKPEDPNSGAALVRRLLADKNSALVPMKGGFGAYKAGTEVVKARNRGEAREAGRHVKEFRDQKRREDFKTKVAFIHNSQKHYRDPRKSLIMFRDLVSNNIVLLLFWRFQCYK